MSHGRFIGGVLVALAVTVLPAAPASAGVVRPGAVGPGVYRVATDHRAAVLTVTGTGGSGAGTRAAMAAPAAPTSPAPNSESGGGDGDGGRLPTTGTGPLPLFAAGFLLIGLGLAALLVRRP